MEAVWTTPRLTNRKPQHRNADGFFPFRTASQPFRTAVHQRRGLQQRILGLHRSRHVERLKRRQTQDCGRGEQSTFALLASARHRDIRADRLPQTWPSRLQPLRMDGRKRRLRMPSPPNISLATQARPGGQLMSAGPQRKPSSGRWFSLSEAQARR